MEILSFIQGAGSIDPSCPARDDEDEDADHDNDEMITAMTKEQSTLDSTTPRNIKGEEEEPLGTLTRFYLVLLGFTEFYLVLLGFTEFYRVLPSFTEFY